MMAMSVYDSNTSHKVAAVLSKYLFYLSGSSEMQIDLSGKAVKKKCHDEVEALRTSVTSLEERVQTYKRRASKEHDIGNGRLPMSDHKKGIDLSAQAASKKHVSELADMSTVLSLADKMAKYNKKTERDKMYFTSGSVVSINGIERNWNKSKTKDDNLKCSKSNKEEEDPLYLAGVFDPLKLDERATKSNSDLSAQAASVKRLSELRSVQAGGLPQPKEDIYNELGELKQLGTDASKMDTDSESKCVDVSTKKYAALIGYDAVSQRSEYYDNTFQKKAPSIDSQRREELQAIMQDKTLGKVERGKKSKLKRCFTNGMLSTMILTALHTLFDS